MTHVQRLRSANDVAKSFGSISWTTHRARQIESYVIDMVLGFWIPPLFLGGCQTPGDKSIITFPSYGLENVYVESVSAFLCESFCRSYRIVQSLHRVLCQQVGCEFIASSSSIISMATVFDGAHLFEPQCWHLGRVAHQPARRLRRRSGSPCSQPDGRASP